MSTIGVHSRTGGITALRHYGITALRLYGFTALRLYDEIIEFAGNIVNSSGRIAVGGRVVEPE
jgi:hypothetical protein